MRRGIVIIAILAGGCASPQNWYEVAGKGPMPGSWENLGVVTFVLIDEGNNPIGTFQLNLTDEIAEDCDDPPGRIARFVGEDTTGEIPAPWYTSGTITPSYHIGGDGLFVNLNALICDDNYLIRAKLVENGAAGVLYWSSPWGS